MPTDKPRFSLTVDAEMLKQIVTSSPLVYIILENQFTCR